MHVPSYLETLLLNNGYSGYEVSIPANDEYTAINLICNTTGCKRDRVTKLVSMVYKHLKSYNDMMNLVICVKDDHYTLLASCDDFT